MAFSSAASVESLTAGLDWSWSSGIGASDCGGGGGLGFLGSGGPIGGFIVVEDDDVPAGSVFRVSESKTGGEPMAFVIGIQRERRSRREVGDAPTAKF